MEIDIEALRRIKRIEKEIGQPFTWNDLVEIFGQKIWYWERKIKPSKAIIEDVNLPTLNLNKLERIALLQALEMTNWVQKDAATLLGLKPKSILTRLDRHNITHHSWKIRKHYI